MAADEEEEGGVGNDACLLGKCVGRCGNEPILFRRILEIKECRNLSWISLYASLYLDIEETDGTLYLSQTPSARRRSLEIINDVNFVIFDAAFLEDYLTFVKIYSFNCLSGFSSIIAMLT